MRDKLVALAWPLFAELVPELYEMATKGSSQRAVLIHLKRRLGEVVHDQIVREMRKR